jgi:geranylgeranyl diphosphate synthase type II
MNARPRERLSQYLEARSAEVDAALSSLLRSMPDCPPQVAEAMQYGVTGGKRLRPLLCLASADAVGGDRALAMPAACAIELIHSYSLIHDDLPAMDNDTMRRGRPTLHVVVGEGMAILAGDGLLTEAFALLSREPRGEDQELVARKLRVIEIIAAAAGPTGMVGGQAMDLASVDRSRAPDDETWRDPGHLQTMHAKKTGALIRAAATAGAIMGGGSEREIATIDLVSNELGLAFQIVDDILDVEGASHEIGKTAGKDAAAGKPTYAALYGVERSRQLAQACLERAEVALDSAGLADSTLVEIARWMVQRAS